MDAAPLNGLPVIGSGCLYFLLVQPQVPSSHVGRHQRCTNEPLFGFALGHSLQGWGMHWQKTMQHYNAQS